MPKKVSPILRVLTEIRDAVRGQEIALAELRDEVRSNRLDLKTEVQELRRHQQQTEIRISTEIIEVVKAIHEVRDAVLGTRGLTAQVRNHESRIGALERRTR